MYKLLVEIPKVKSFAIDNSWLLLSNSNLVKDHDKDKNILRTEQNLQNLKITDKQTFINTVGGIGYLISPIESQCLGYPIQHVSYPYILSYKREAEGKNAVIKNIKDIGFERSIQMSSTIFMVSGSKYFRWNPQLKCIEVFEFPSSKFVWKFNIDAIGLYCDDSNQEKKYEVRQFLGIWKDYLLILLSNCELLMLDKGNGTLIKKINKIPPQKMGEHTIDSIGNCIELDIDSGRLKGFVNFVFWEFDLSTFNFDCFNLANTLIDNNLDSLMNITSYAQCDEHYFLTMFKIDDTSSMISHLVALNKESKNIDWVYELPWTGVNVPKYANSRLYQLDNNNTLHIFERD